MKKIVISPYSRKLRNGKKNPKDYPYWNELVFELRKKHFFVVQIGVSGEDLIQGVDEVQFDKTYKEIEELLKGCYTFISVDNLLPHLAHAIKKSGIVIFARSNPKIFGYGENANFLKDTKYLRNDQFGTWEECDYIEESFISPNCILGIIDSIK